MPTFIDHLIAQSRASPVVAGVDLNGALTQLDRMLEDLAADLQVEFYGPHVGLFPDRPSYRLVVRAHVWDTQRARWGLAVCTALPSGGWRADWRVQAVSRLRRNVLVQALPEFFVGFAAVVRAAGKGDSGAGRRLCQIADQFRQMPT